MLKKGVHHSPTLQRSWDKHGASIFEFFILEQIEDVELLLPCEQKWMDELRSSSPAHGFNVCSVAGTRRGVPQPASVAEKMSAFHMGKPKSTETRLKMSVAAKGKTKSETHKQKLREAAQRQFADPAARKKAAEYGKLAAPHTISDVMRQKLNAGIRRFAATPEGRTRQAKATEAARIANTGGTGYWAGKTMSEETRQAMSVARKGKKRQPSDNFKHSAEWRLNHSMKIKQNWALRKAQQQTGESK